MLNREHLELIGKTANYFINEMIFEVKVIDVRNAYGRIDYKVLPIAGCNSKWVSEDSIMLS